MADAGRTPRLLAAVLLLGGLAWRTADALVAIGAEVASTPRERLVAGLAGDAEERMRWTAGEDAAVLRAVREHVPEDEPLFVVGHLGLEEQRARTTGAVRTKRVYSLLQAFLFPRAVVALEGEVGAAEILAYRGPKRPYALELDLDADLPWEQGFDEVASGEGFRLWRWRGDG